MYNRDGNGGDFMKGMKIFAGIFTVALTSSIVLYDINFDHTKGECMVTKILNMIPVENDEIPLGVAFHQVPAIHLENDDSVDVWIARRGRTQKVDVYKDGVLDASLEFRRKNKELKRFKKIR